MKPNQIPNVRNQDPAKGDTVKKRLPSPSMVVALVALGVALGGSAVAASSSLITGAQIKNHSIGFNDLSKTAVAKLRGQRGPVGAEGPTGPDGSTGADGAAGGFDPAKVQIVQGDVGTVEPGQVGTVYALCPAGTIEVGGGGYASIGRMALSGPSANGQPGWTFAVLNDASVELTSVRAYVECAAP